MMKEWFTAAELAGQKGMPAHATNVTRKAKSQSWHYRQITGLRGVNFEYHASSLPKETQEALGLKDICKYLPEVETNTTEMIEIQIYSAKDRSWNKAKVVSRMMLSRRHLPKYLSNQDIKQLFALEVLDNTMQPSINAGEVVLALRVASKTDVSTGVFVVESNAEVTIRRLKPNLAATEIKVCCDSDQFDDEVLRKTDFDQSIRLVGNVIGVVIRNVV